MQHPIENQTHDSTIERSNENSQCTRRKENNKRLNRNDNSGQRALMFSDSTEGIRALVKSRWDHSF